MKPTTLLASCAAAATTALGASVPQSAAAGHRIPTSYESAIMGRRILAKTPLAVVSTIFPADSDSDSEASPDENRPAGMGGQPHGLMEYIADCDPSSATEGGNPTILAISIETSFKNVAAGSNVSLAVQWTPPHPPAKRIASVSSFLSRFLGGEKQVADPSTYSAANLPRFSLHGHIERIDGGDRDKNLAACFVKTHPDARYWLPGNRIHESHFVRLVVEQVYWVGGFGDRAYIGWIPVGEWRGVTREEWEAVRLPGEEKGWKEWSLLGDDL
ncbi:pyridoxamine 5'-phosphate oxidase-domain-containing protein [Echria macrotheca]|uniref:Pyridoxamine 5'-phosphate oxidase-domain-containing protein n=1 Tax=Echria macrotheca TaxID=438768 RepID=A0AAJ0FE70_9PEZI|nr:pyridoxamine 5'-phosphate oxidase-domain-containing protein [Echria macrotheca]